jgi:hypothetical protein
MAIVIFILLPIYLIINTYSFRFQRTTLSIARTIGDRRIKSAITPPWAGIMGWISWILLIALAVLIFFVFSWIWSLVLLIYSFAGTALIDLITPVPSYQHCFTKIKIYLNSNLENPKNNSVEGIHQLIEAVDNIEAKYLSTRKTT